MSSKRVVEVINDNTITIKLDTQTAADVAGLLFAAVSFEDEPSLEAVYHAINHNIAEQVTDFGGGESFTRV